MSMTSFTSLPDTPATYAAKLADALACSQWEGVSTLTDWMSEAWRGNAQVFLCGNGGSAANALHWANDFIYPLAPTGRRALRIHALPANVSCLTCIANDKGYEHVFSHQLETLANPGDLLVALSGSGNSPNIVRAIEAARTLRMRSAALLGFSGGKCLALADLPIHFPIDDMQIVEDLQVIVGHMIMRAMKEQSHA